MHMIRNWRFEQVRAPFGETTRYRLRSSPTFNYCPPIIFLNHSCVYVYPGMYGPQGRGTLKVSVFSTKRVETRKRPFLLCHGPVYGPPSETTSWATYV